MSDEVTEVSYQSWFSRIGGALSGMFVGLFLFVVAFPILFMNEGRAVHRAQDLEEGQKNVETVDVAVIDPAKEGKLVFASGTATTDETLRDPMFGITTKGALRLKRVVEMYLWKETEQTETKKNIGGGETTTKTYSYSKIWSTDVINSSVFHQPQGHVNPQQFPCPAAEFVATVIHLGAFQIPEALKASFQNTQPLSVDGSKPPTGIADGDSKRWRVVRGEFYAGVNDDSPEIGDVRVHFQQVPSGPCDLLAMQEGTSFTPYTTRRGGNLFELRTGHTSKDGFFQQLNDDNNLITWLLRLAGFLLLLFGLLLLFRPMSVLADIVPFFGTLVAYGTGSLAFLLALPLWLITVGIGWVAYRPLLGIGLLILSAGLIFLLVRGISRSKRARHPATAGLLSRGVAPRRMR